MTDKPNDQDKKHRPPPKKDSRKKPVASITGKADVLSITSVGISVSPGYDYRRGGKKKK